MITRRALLGLALALAGGCGYSTGVRLPEHIQTVGVEVFGNDSRQRDIEADLQQQLSDAVARLVHARLVPPEQADLIVRGRIVDYARRGGIRSPQNELLETGVRITIEAQLVQRFAQSQVVEGAEPARSDLPPSPDDDRNTMPRTAQNERVLRPVRATQEFGYMLAEDFGEAVARERTLRNLSERVVLDLFTALPPVGQP